LQAFYIGTNILLDDILQSAFLPGCHRVRTKPVANSELETSSLSAAFNLFVVNLQDAPQFEILQQLLQVIVGFSSVASSAPTYRSDGRWKRFRSPANQA
jgi:hypothetical protein